MTYLVCPFVQLDYVCWWRFLLLSRQVKRQVSGLMELSRFMGVTPKSSIYRWIFHYEPSILKAFLVPGNYAYSSNRLESEPSSFHCHSFVTPGYELTPDAFPKLHRFRLGPKVNGLPPSCFSLKPLAELRQLRCSFGPVFATPLCTCGANVGCWLVWPKTNEGYSILMSFFRGTRLGKPRVMNLKLFFSLACWHSALACQHSRAQHSLFRVCILVDMFILI